MDIKNLNRVIEQIADERGIDKSMVAEAVESAVAAAYRKEFGKRGENIKAEINFKTGSFKFWKIRTVVDETTVRVKEEGKEPEIEDKSKESEKELLPLYNSERHIFLDEAKAVKSDVKIDEELEFPLEEREDFGRIAAQAAKQVVLQKIREAERESIKKEYAGKEGEIVSGVIQRIERGNVFVDIGRAVGVMFFNETIPGEYYRIGERLKFYLLAVQEESGRSPGLVLSRSHPKFVSKLFELEVPEIHEGTVEIKAIAREPGNRTKIAVDSKVEGVDPVGACVGQRGTRVMAVTNELGNEKIDIIEWSENPDKFVAAALSPAKAKAVEILPRREARVFVPEDQLSLAIGKGGQNVRLAAKLTGWKIDVRSLSRPEEAVAEGIAEAGSEIEKSEEKE
ncbi:MAG: NusA antitermination factor [Candidatus Wolfebacteria bacterium GW2011_GWA2_42_10]|uniref:Transcription termination/antitermination protein NusA n=2 Tax=Candidatus Wolfeibacteriota TaxID=1752735 RepID=A0A0G1AJH4_9BACT|nr:MAG: NusA antitermination factor [Candidatus Wolfebacteria bacterium GW2011_GWB1_41_12]KKS25448.1 MAG: NusA antitermination factor [Candidatus Wolfebacteria bacterium GW2011_GWA2_42_10]KKT56624.1 MAG: NusA antitermination factor [Candidatus Wolfebacteria bacterium GW2011_GWA1_44_24]